MNYTEIKYDIVSQITRGKLGFSKVKFYELEEVVRFTARIEEKTDPLSNDSEINKVKIENQRFYQRLIADKRTDKIQQFIIGEAIKEYKNKLGLSKISSLGLFPTSTLIAVNIFPCDTIKEYEENYYDYEKKDGNQITLCFEKEQTIFLPKGEKIALIVDGQHRIAALKHLYYKVNDSLTYKGKLVKNIVDESFFPFLRDRIKNFDILCTLLINFDIYEQGEIFASVNFNQKPVNRSLYYDIFGSSPKTERNELKLSHDLVSHLNYNEDSVLKGLIDMLGERNGIVSQSAVMENIMKLFGRGKVWNDLYLDYRTEVGQDYKLIGQFLRLYFRQIKNSFREYWPQEGVTKSNEYHSVLIKTTGMGAFIRLINDIYTDINPDHKKTKKELEQNLKEIFSKIEKNKKLYFDKESAFVKGAGQGLQAKLYKQIAFDLGYRNTPD
jgi:DGQHR domain-containing protein